MSAQTSTSKSRATRSAAQAKQDQAAAEQDAVKAAEAGEIEPTTEAAEQAAAEAATLAAAEADLAGTEPDLPTGKLDIGTYAWVMHKPKVTGPDGVEHGCPHRDGHTKIRAAMACARSLAAEHGLTVGDADPAWQDGGARPLS